MKEKKRKEKNARKKKGEELTKKWPFVDHKWKCLPISVQRCECIIIIIILIIDAPTTSSPKPVKLKSLPAAESCTYSWAALYNIENMFDVY